ncbi:MAG: hypothetical protein IT373_17840 [Polyangiaceae bacterium]|nr:hypothetical protein [Polyangiaceae bacterium]
MNASLKIAALGTLLLASTSFAACHRLDADDAAASAAQAAQDGCGSDGCVCDPADASCPPPPCDPSDASCPPPPCDPSDSNCPPPPCDPSDATCPVSCAADEAKGDGACDAVLGYAWQGCACVPVSGCACVGPSCDALAPSLEKCELAHANCDCAPPASDCEALASELDALLTAIRSCDPASMQPVEVCNTVVPTVWHCDQPANGNAPELALYLELFGKYASDCYLPDPPCPVVDPLALACAETADGTGGQCVFE